MGSLAVRGTEGQWLVRLFLYGTVEFCKDESVVTTLTQIIFSLKQ